MILSNDWKNRLAFLLQDDNFKNIQNFLDTEYKTKEIFPPRNQIFECFNLTEFNNIKVVIIGQDPYHGQNQANGLAFSVNTQIKIPPSLKNIFKEVTADTQCQNKTNGNLINWAKQGVLLLNNVLTVESGKPNSHKNCGWIKFTDSVIEYLSKSTCNLVFLLWGNNAISKSKLIDSNKHLVLTAPHPSPLSCYHGFLGCKHFSKANEYLEKHNIEKIEW